ncbi:hypothetical protein ABH19_09630 [Leptospirillum sp. Group II 'CF-1']|nr:hypothetical protein ABH19_09630 [Leptospirillum sp. Group II 'CF-1']
MGFSAGFPDNESFQNFDIRRALVEDGSLIIKQSDADGELFLRKGLCGSHGRKGVLRQGAVSGRVVVHQGVLPSCVRQGPRHFRGPCRVSVLSLPGGRRKRCFDATLPGS